MRSVKSYLNLTVLEAARQRVRRIFDEFPVVVVNFSGGKDSTVVLNLAIEAARERARLPLFVFWLDQEAEWSSVVEFVRATMNRPEVKPLWFQGHFKLFNATTTGADPWLHCWRPGDDWMRQREPNSIHVNRCGTDRFHELFAKFFTTYFPKTPLAKLSGVRCEESPSRQQGLTSYATYKDITWGRVESRRHQHYTFYPLYDWSYTDVWKAIHEHGWAYCKLYDIEYQYGVSPRDMRVSNVHHETAVDNLRFLQEIEPDTWNRVTARLASTNAVPLVRELFKVPAELPSMFETWREYRDHLLAHLITVDKIRQRFAHQFKLWDGRFRIDDPEVELKLLRVEVKALLVNDYEGTSITNFTASHPKFLRGVGTGDTATRSR